MMGVVEAAYVVRGGASHSKILTGLEAGSGVWVVKSRTGGTDLVGLVRACMIHEKFARCRLILQLSWAIVRVSFHGMRIASETGKLRWWTRTEEGERE